MRSSVLGLIAAVVVPAAASAAPSGLYGKSVTVTWTETRSQRDVGEPAFRPVGIPWEFTVYVSSEGRPFRRLTATSRGGRGSQEGVGLTTSKADRTVSMQFQGNTLISSSSSSGFGRRIQVNFDGGFGSCTAQIIAAKQAGSKSVTVRSVSTKGMVEIESVSAGAASCAIRNGNAFAN